MSKKGDEGRIYIATESGSADVDGTTLSFVRGVTRVRAPHPLLDQCPAYFKPAEDGVTYGAVPPDVEQATAAPGEKRGAARAKDGS